jgi:hypothetical protein
MENTVNTNSKSILVVIDIILNILLVPLFGIEELLTQLLQYIL